MKLLCAFLCCLLLSSCGKKAEVENSTKKGLGPTEAERYFYTFQALKDAVFNNNVQALDEAFKNDPGVDLGQILDNGETFLTVAILNDYHDIRDKLIYRGCPLNQTNIKKETPLMIAVQNLKEESIKTLLFNNVDLEKKNLFGDTVLHIAIKNNYDDVAHLLLKEGASKEALDRDGYDALKLASLYDVPKTLDYIKMLEELGSGTPTIAYYRELLESGDYLRLGIVLKKFPRLAFDDAYEEINPLSILAGLTNETNAFMSAKLLIDYQSNVNGPDSAPETPLIRAVKLRKKRFVELFLRYNASTERRDNNGWTALLHAVNVNDLEVVNMLLKKSADAKYSIKKEAGKVTYDACDVAEKKLLELTSDEDKLTNGKIKKLLSCGIFGWTF